MKNYLKYALLKEIDRILVSVNSDGILGDEVCLKKFTGTEMLLYSMIKVYALKGCPFMTVYINWTKRFVV